MKAVATAAYFHSFPDAIYCFYKVSEHTDKVDYLHSFVSLSVLEGRGRSKAQ